MFQKMPFTLLLTLLWLLLAATACRRSAQSETVATPADSVAQAGLQPLVNQVAHHARLYTYEAHVHKIVTYSDDPTLEGHVLHVPFKVPARLGNRKVAIPLDVTLQAYVDFTHFGAEQVERTDSSIVITLPDPVIVATASKVDHRGTRQYIDGLRNRFSEAELSALARQGVDSIVQHTPLFGLQPLAERSATTTLVPMLRRMGYSEEQITVRFRKRFSEAELRSFIIRH